MALAESAELRGRGGAGFPAARKIRAVAARRRRPVVVVNASEGEPASGKDAALLRLAPHVVLDGAELLAQALATRDVRVWAPGHDPAAAAVLAAAVNARAGGRRSVQTRVVLAPDRFVAGESTAAARGLSGQTAIPRADGRRTSDTGVNGRPTLLLNVETVSQLARLARGQSATRLVTVLGAVRSPGVIEIEDGTAMPQVLAAVGGTTQPVRAFVLGGYHGIWAPADAASQQILGSAGSLVPDCSIIVALPDDACLLAELDGVGRFLAAESARQCGPCAFGLPQLAASVRSVRRGAVSAQSVSEQGEVLIGRGACSHPDGSVRFLSSGLQVLAEEVAAHRAGDGDCGRPLRRVLPLPDPALIRCSA